MRLFRRLAPRNDTQSDLTFYETTKEGLCENR